jgi:hypothetical protein
MGSVFKALKSSYINWRIEMGYYVDIDLMVKVVDTEGCLKAINELHKPENLEKDASGGSFSGGKTTAHWYSWVRNPESGSFDTIESAIEEWRYRGSKDVDGFYIYGFDGEKWGDDEVFYNAIAPYCDGDIYCRGEDGNMWGYRMKSGSPLTELTAEWREI